MANILDYLDWRGDLTLAERGFNEVDNLLMAELCFLDFSGIVPADFFGTVFSGNGTDIDNPIQNPIDLSNAIFE